MVTPFILGLAVLSGAIQIFLFAKSLLYVKVLYSRRHLPRVRGVRPLPTVHLVVPCKGHSKRLETVLRSFAAQDYPGTYRLTVVNESVRDPNNALLKQLAAELRHVRHVTAGLATACSQKNHNLLAALAGDRQSDVLAFADADVLVTRTWLRDLVQPLALGKQWLTTGVPTAGVHEPSLPQMVHAALTAYQAKLLLSFGFLWGGSMAMWRETFDSLGAREHWARTVVDDISLFQLLQEHNLRVLLGRSHGERLLVMPVPDLDLDVPSNVNSYSGLTRWFVRQILYVKYHRRLTWHAAVWGNLLNLLLIFGAPLLLFLPESRDLHLGGQIGLSYFFLIHAINLGLPLIRRQNDSSLLQWMKVSWVGDILANFALQKSAFTDELTWAEIRYRLGRDGTVEEVIHPEHTLPAGVRGAPAVRQNAIPRRVQ